MPESRLTQFRNGPHTFDVIDSGPLDGTPVVLLHGFPQRASAWDTVAGHLHEQGLRTYAPDQRGYSPGARPSVTIRVRHGRPGLGRRGADRRDRCTPRAPRRPRLGCGVAWSVAGHHRRQARDVDRGVGGSPGGVPAVVADQQPGAEVVLHGAVPAPRSCLNACSRAAVPTRSLRKGGMTHEMVKRVPHRDRRLRRATRRARLLPLDLPRFAGQDRQQDHGAHDVRVER